MAVSWYEKYRPQSLDEVVGQPAAVDAIRGFGKDVPNAVLLEGQSGGGKTTVARIMARIVGCPPENRMDYCEVNCGIVKSPIETVRDIHHAMTARGMGGGNRVWVLDEAQTLSRQKGSQEALLKILEGGPPHAYFFVATTDPDRLLKTVRGRCTRVVFGPVSDKDVAAVVRRVAAAERVDPPPDDELVDAVVAAAAGSLRVALVELEKAAGVADPEDRLRAVGCGGTERAAFDLVKVLMPFAGSPSWGDVAKVLTGLADHDPETVRRVVLAAARTTLLKHGNKPAGKHACKVVHHLSDPLFDRPTGNALLAAGCYKIVFGPEK